MEYHLAKINPVIGVEKINPVSIVQHQSWSIIVEHHLTKINPVIGVEKINPGNNGYPQFVENMDDGVPLGMIPVVKNGGTPIKGLAPNLAYKTRLVAKWHSPLCS